MEEATAVDLRTPARTDVPSLDYQSASVSGGSPVTVHSVPAAFNTGLNPEAPWFDLGPSVSLDTALLCASPPTFFGGFGSPPPMHFGDFSSPLPPPAPPFPGSMVQLNGVAASGAATTDDLKLRDKQLPPLPLHARLASDSALAPAPLSIAPLSTAPSGQGRPVPHATELLEQNTRLQHIIALQESEIAVLKKELEQTRITAENQNNAIKDVLRTTSLAFKRYREVTDQQCVPAHNHYLR
ncbi:hypothetical protein MY10362_000302 [Beauveria mimosiformis]